MTNQMPKRTYIVASRVVLDRSDISLSIRGACGMDLNKNLSDSPVATMIERRERGPNFSCRQKSKITNCYLPNHMQRIDKYSKKPFCGTFSKNGHFLLTTEKNKTLTVYRADNGKYKEIKKFFASNVGFSILDTAFNPDNKYFVYSSWSNNLYMNSIYGDPNARERLRINTPHSNFSAFSVAYSSDGRELFCAGNDRHLYIYDLGSQNCIRVFGHESDINSVAFADESSQILISAGDDAICKVWDRRLFREHDPRPVGIFIGHMGGITCVDVRGDDRHLITNSKDQTIKLWDTRKFSSERTREKIEFFNYYFDYRWEPVPKLFLNPRQRITGDTSLMTYRGHIVTQTLIRCHFSPTATTGQRYIYTGCGLGRIIIYDVLTGKIVKELKGHKKVVRDVSWHPTHQEIVSTSWDGQIACWRYYEEDANYQIQDELSDGLDTDSDSSS